MFQPRARHVAVRPLVLAVLGAFLAGCPSDKPSPPPAPGIVVSATTLATSEAGPRVPFTVSLATMPMGGLFVQVCSGDTTEGQIEYSFYGANACVEVAFGPTDWNVPKTVYVSPVDEAVADGNQTYTVTASISTTLDDAYLGVPARTLSVTNADDDVPGITVTQSGGSTVTTETPTTDTFTVVLNTQPSGTVTVPVTSGDATEGLLRGGDSPATSVESLALTFTTVNWNVPQTVTVLGQVDHVDDGTVDFTVTVGAATGAAEYLPLPATAVPVKNIDNDSAGITVSATPSPLVTSENGTSATFSVVLNSRPVNDVVVAITSGNAAEGLLLGGSSPATPVSALDLAFTPADWNVAQQVTVTGQDDVATPVLGDDVSYTVTVGPATGDPMYVGLASQSVPVQNFDNDQASLIVPASTGPALVTREVGTGNAATFTVGINRQPTANVVVPVTVGDASEGLLVGGSSPTTAVPTLNLTFTAADFLTAQTVTLVGQADGVVDGNQSHAITVGPPTGDAAYTSLPAKTIPVINLDSNVAGYTVSKASLTTTEGAAAVTFAVTLSAKPAADVVIPVASGDAAEGLLSGDGGASWSAALSLTFTPTDWATTRTIQVKGPLDWIDDGDKTYTITVGPTQCPGTPYDGLAAKTITVKNVDVDTAGYAFTPLPQYTVTEAGGTATFGLSLKTIPSSPVTVPLSVSDPTEVLLSAGGSPATSVSLVFDAGNWNVPQPVTLTGQQDGELDGNRYSSVSVGKGTGDATYAALSTGFNVITVDDEVGVSEGTASPVPLTNGVARLGQVGPASASFYVVSLPAGAPFGVSVADVTAPLILTADDDGDFAAGNLCTTTLQYAFSRGACSGVVPASGTVHVRVSTSSTAGAGFMLYAGTARTYTSTDVPLATNIGYQPSSQMTVSGGPLALSKVTVKLSVTHKDVSELALELWGPAPDYTYVRLTYHNGGGANFTDTQFDDAAASAMYGSPPYTGTYKPFAPLAGFAGDATTGEWSLRVEDTAGGYSGTLDAWAITIY